MSDEKCFSVCLKNVHAFWSYSEASFACTLINSDGHQNLLLQTFVRTKKKTMIAIHGRNPVTAKKVAHGMVI